MKISSSIAQIGESNLVQFYFNVNSKVKRAQGAENYLKQQPTELAHKTNQEESE